MSKTKTLKQLSAIGKALAMAFVNSENLASKTKREALLVSAESVTNKESAKAILTAYADTLTEKGLADNIIRVRKAEANTVFKAVLVTGLNLEELKAFDGNYNAFVQFARTLIPAKAVNPKSPTSEGEVVTKERKNIALTDKQVESVDNAIEKASASQLADLVDSASIQIQKVVAPKMASHQSLILINSIANKIVMNAQAEEYERNVAQSIVDISQEAIDRLNQVIHASAKATKATTMAKKPKGVAKEKTVEVES